MSGVIALRNIVGRISSDERIVIENDATISEMVETLLSACERQDNDIDMYVEYCGQEFLWCSLDCFSCTTKGVLHLMKSMLEHGAEEREC